MPKLIATRPILYLAHQYKVGDELPQELHMAAIWVETKSAVWKEEGQTAEKMKKAKSVVAQPGIVGKSSDGDQEALIGRVSKQR